MSFENRQMSVQSRLPAKLEVEEDKARSRLQMGRIGTWEEVTDVDRAKELVLQFGLY